MYKSIIEYFADKSASQCGYCRSTNGSYSNGMWGHVMTCQDYQDLLDRGWRRSGRYCYKPTMNKTCCPQYTIKCDATQFQLTKSQKKIMKKFRTYIINGGDLPQNDFPSSSSTIDINSGDESEEFSDEEDVQNDEEKTDNKMDVENAEKAKAIDMETKLKLDPNVKVQVTTADESVVKPTNCHDVMDSGSKDANVKRGIGPDPTKPKSKKEKRTEKRKSVSQNVSLWQNRGGLFGKERSQK